MDTSTPEFTIGIEEEYLLVNRDNLALQNAPPEMWKACEAELEGQVSPEFLKCQIEIGSKVWPGIEEAREDLKRLRVSISKHAAKYNLVPISAGSHPFSDWRDQHHTDKERYNILSSDLALVVQRMLICGMHVHLGISSPDRRIDIMNQLSYFLPHLLALSCSSPFWLGRDTGLDSYRLSVFDTMPRTGVPPNMVSFGEYEKSISDLVEIGIVEDSSKIWWDLRPSARFPTLEARIFDVQPRLEHGLSLAALTQAIARMLWRLSTQNLKWRIYDTFLITENRWRAQRYGINEGLIDFGINKIVPVSNLVEELLELVEQDARHFKSANEIEKIREIVKHGNSADRQREIYKERIFSGDENRQALKAVVEHLIEEFHADL